MTIRDASLVSKYAFGTRTATFHVCSTCSAVPLVTSATANHPMPSSRQRIGERHESWLCRAAANFDGEDIESVSRADNAIGLPRFGSPKRARDRDTSKIR